MTATESQRSAFQRDPRLIQRSSATVIEAIVALAFQ